nr:protamine mP2 intermediate protein pmP2/5 [mice, Peptide Partial, 10 aa] [Mus sp.]
MRSPSEGPHQ